MPIFEVISIHSRAKTFLIGFLVLWPLTSIFFTTCELMHMPYYSAPAILAFLGASAGWFLLSVEYLICGSILASLGIALFSGCQFFQFLKNKHQYKLEVMCFLTAVTFWVVLFYPAIASHHMFRTLSQLPYWSLILLLLGLITILARRLAEKAVGFIVIFALVNSIGCIVALLPTIRSMTYTFKDSPASTVVLGLDSISTLDDVELLKTWIKSNNGTWYEKAVTPGLLTNSVWTSILTMVPVSVHRTFYTFQPFPVREGKPDSLLLKFAQQHGFRSIAIFPDQMTCYVGSQGGFDEDRSGPVGWRQLISTASENSSIFLPLFRRWFPNRLFSPIISNHAGTFTYDLDMDLREIFNNYNQKSLVLSHNTYLHSNCFPSLLKLTVDSWKKVVKMPIIEISDQSFDWQYTDSLDTGIPLNKWKLNQLQKSLIAAVRDTRFLDRGGRLIIFSDHGMRKDLDENGIDNPNYFHVLFATIGLPSCPPEKPISLIKIAELLGFGNFNNYQAKVEYASISPELWPEIYRTCRLHWNGVVEIQQSLLDQAFKSLKAHEPWKASKSQIE